MEKDLKGVRFHKAYHGTPHRFDKFTTEAIGTGEGAQAFGWGIYFADAKSVAEYYKIKMADMLSKRRNRSVARPRQVAMSLAKELTNHSLPEIGDAFGGRDHTTVLHACKQIKKLRGSSQDLAEDYNNLLRALAT
jgi:hypothetical protein